jgi:hypothetical protein
MRLIRKSLLALAAATTFVASSCGDAPVAPSPTAAPTFTGSVAPGLLSGVNSILSPLVTCQALPLTSVSKVIGVNGGIIVAGPFALTVPQGALAGNVAITAKVVPGAVNRVHFEPAGLQFSKPAILAMSYSNCQASRAPKRIAYVSDSLDVLEYLPSYDSQLLRTVFGVVEHFSDYVIAW